MSNNKTPPNTPSTSASDLAQVGTAQQVNTNEETGSATQTGSEPPQNSVEAQTDVNPRMDSTSNNPRSAAGSSEQTAETYVADVLWNVDPHEAEKY